MSKVSKKTFSFAIMAVFISMMFFDFRSVLAQTCQSNIPVKSGDNYSVSLDSGTEAKITRLLKPSFFGFNMEWIEFQDSFLNKKTKKVHPVLVEWMKAFPGAVYRYPGGTVANNFNWMEAVGDVSLRKMQIGAEWRGPLAVRFGIDEYLSFVNQVAGQSWIVANLYGRFEGEEPIADLAKQAAMVAEHVLKANREQGVSPVLRWELGNELDRGDYLWPAKKYSDRSAKIIDAIKAVIPGAKFVGIAEDYDAQTGTSGLNAREYNNFVVSKLADNVHEYANHLYYDGGENGPPIPDRLGQLCTTLDSLQKVLPATKASNAGIWITEHARWPIGGPSDSDWQSHWPKATNLQAGISVADMMIATVQFPQIKGSFIHTLSGTVGPWPFFHEGAKGTFHPSVIYWTLRILREAMLDEVLTTQTVSANLSNYAGGYDVRVAVLRKKNHKKYAVWAINRHAKAVTLDIKIPLCTGCTLLVNKTELSGQSPKATNSINKNSVLPHKTTETLAVNKQGYAKVSLAAYSVSTFIIDTP